MVPTSCLLGCQVYQAYGSLPAPLPSSVSCCLTTPTPPLGPQVSLTQQEAAEVFSLAPLTPYQLLSQGKGPYGTKRAGTSQTRVLHQDVMEAGQQTEPVSSAGCRAWREGKHGSQVRQ